MNLHQDGIEIKEGFIPASVISEIKTELKESGAKVKRYGLSQADKKLQSIQKLVDSQALQELAIEILGAKPSTLRVIYLDKTKDGNWFLPWHQDIKAAVNRKDETLQWEGWSLEQDINYVQLPRKVLHKMVTFRVNLDDANEDNACLQVIPGSHLFGILHEEKINKLVTKVDAINCCVKAGDLVLMSPLTLHASSKSNKPSHRGVVHIEYCSYELPEGTHWI